MFYYGLDFHDLAPNSFLISSAFVVVCEAFLRIPPLQPMAQGIQHEAESGGWSTHGLRRCNGEKASQRHLALGHLRGDHEGMAAGVALCHGTL